MMLGSKMGRIGLHPSVFAKEANKGLTAVTSKPRRALERTHYRVSGISVSSAYRIARIAMTA